MPESAVDFSGVRLKQARAEKHIGELAPLVAAFLARGPFGFRHEQESGESGATAHRVVAIVREEPPVDQWAPMIGDAVHNLRSALDHAVWAIADPASRHDRAEYPICSTEQAFRDKAWQLAGVSERRCELIRGEQPFHWLEPNRSAHTLGMLQWLDNEDKHRTLHALAAFSEFRWVALDNADVTTTFLFPEHATLHGDTEVWRFETVPGDPARPVIVDPRVEFEIGIEGTHNAMLLSLRELARYVEHHIIRPLEHPDAYPYPPLDPPDMGGGASDAGSVDAARSVARPHHPS